MRSGELAALAGVSVRTLRHYHQLGVLAEPSRGGNGYREYSVHDLIALLRLRRLAALGIPLEDARQVLEARPADRDAALAELDDELADQIARLQTRRAAIAALRAVGAEPDVPPALAPTAAALMTARSGAAGEVDRELLLLLTHLSEPASQPALVALLDSLVAIGADPAAHAAQERFDRLAVGAGDAERAALAADMLELYRPLLTGIDADEVRFAPVLVRLVQEYTDDRLNPAQRDVLARVDAGLPALLDT